MQHGKPPLDHIQTISFDAGGTLIVPHPSVGEVYAEVLAGFGIRVDPSVLETAFRLGFKGWKQDCPGVLLDQAAWRDIVHRTLHDHCPPETFDSIFLALWGTFAEGRRWRILPGVRETLQKLSAARYRLVVMSNNDPRMHRVLDELRLARFFEKVFVSVEIGAEKPNPAAFRAVELALDLPPKAILHVGDSPREDAAGALDAGWQAALLGEPQTEAPGAFAIASVSDLCDLLLPRK